MYKFLASSTGALDGRKMLSAQQENSDKHTWRARVGHIANRTLQEAVLRRSVYSLPSELSTGKAELHKNCHGCMAGKMTRINFKRINSIKSS